MGIKHTFIAVLSAALSVTTGCVNAPESGKTLDAQTNIVSVDLAQMHEQDNQVARSLLVANLNAQRVLLTGSVYRSFIVADFIDTTGAANTDKLRAAISDSTKSGPLVDEVRNGVLSVDAACEWLTDYAALSKIKSGREARDKMLSTIAVVRVYDAGTSDLLKMWDARWDAVRQAYVEQAANRAALSKVFDQSPTFDSNTIGTELSGLVASQVKDPQTAGSIKRLIDTVFPHTPQ